MATRQKSTSSSRKTPAALSAYLVFYNVASAAGWAYLLFQLITHLLDLDGQSPVPQGAANTVPLALKLVVERAATAYGRIGDQTRIVQSFAVLEVVHALLGWVRSPVGTTVMQVSSRLFLVWGITYQFPAETHSNPIFASMLMAWSVTEVIRYAFYAFGLMGFSAGALLWLRYTTFYVLYPLGAGSEAFLMLATVPRTFLPPRLQPLPAKPVAEWTPGQLGRAVLFLIWWPGLYTMYTYMIRQRRKVLGGPKRKVIKTQ